jgi:hypothetical protein
VPIFKAALGQHPLRRLECRTADHQVDGARQNLPLVRTTLKGQSSGGMGLASLEKHLIAEEHLMNKKRTTVSIARDNNCCSKSNKMLRLWLLLGG